MIAPRTFTARGWVEGEPKPFLQGHDPLYIVDPESGCWMWQRAIDKNGYGAYGHRIAHRVIYEREVGPIPGGLEIDHLCRTRACVNPAHMEPVTHAENMRRAVRPGPKRGSSPGPTGRRERARAVRGAEGTYVEIAERFDISTGMVWRIKSGRCWPSVQEETA